MTDSAAELYSDIIEEYHPAVTKAAGRGDLSFISDELRLHLRQLGLDIDESTEAYRKLAYSVLTTESELNHARIAQEVGRTVAIPKFAHTDLKRDIVSKACHQNHLQDALVDPRSLHGGRGQIG